MGYELTSGASNQKRRKLYSIPLFKDHCTAQQDNIALVINQLNLLALELFFSTLAHPVYKMWIKQEPNMLELWNKLHFEKKKTESIYHV